LWFCVQGPTQEPGTAFCDAPQTTPRIIRGLTQSSLNRYIL